MDWAFGRGDRIWVTGGHVGRVTEGDLCEIAVREFGVVELAEKVNGKSLSSCFVPELRHIFNTSPRKNPHSGLPKCILKPIYEV